LEDMMVLRDVLGHHVAELSTWDEYKTEVERYEQIWRGPRNFLALLQAMFMVYPIF
jgi:hypothetical protein